jgi:hypothetical protein
VSAQASAAVRGGADRPPVFAVTGGTRQYSGVDGHVTATPATVKGATATLLAFHLDH